MPPQRMMIKNKAPTLRYSRRHNKALDKDGSIGLKRLGLYVEDGP